MGYVDKNTGWKEEPFVKLYIQDLALLKRLTLKERLVYDKMVQIFGANAPYDKEYQFELKDIKGKLMEYADIHEGSLKNCLTALVKANMIDRIGKGVYILNPLLIFKGKQGTRAELVARYSADGRFREIFIREVSDDNS